MGAKRGARRLSAVVGGALTAGAVLWPDAPAAQGVALPDPGQALRAAEARARPAPGALPAAPELRFTSQTPPTGADALFFTLGAVTLEGATVYAPEDLAPLWADRLGAEISVAEAFALAADVQSRYREDGYIFTRVVVPAQRIEGGELRLEVLEAVIATVSVEQPQLPVGPVIDLARRIASRLEGRVNPTLQDVERVLLLLNDIPGITRAAAVPKLGEAGRGAVDLFINMERDAFGVTAFADNRQSPILGPGLFGLVGAFNSWSPWGDSTALSWFNSFASDDWRADSLEERFTLQADHSTFLGSNGLRLALRALYSESQPGARVRDLDITGDQQELEATLRWPAMRTRALSFDLYGGLYWADIGSLTPAGTVIEIPGRPPIVVPDLVVDDRLRVAYAGATMTQRDTFGYTEALLELRRGLGIAGASEPNTGELSRQDGSGRFWSLRGELERSLALEKGVSLWAKGWGQLAERPLLASEEMSIGGPELGRAFHPSEASGDMGYGAALELRLNQTLTWEGLRVPIEVYGYADAAEVRNLRGGTPRDAALVSAGFGLRAQLFGNTALNLEAARPINKPLAYNGSDAWRFLFSATREF